MRHDIRIAAGTVVSTFTGEHFAADVLVRGDQVSGIVAPEAEVDADTVLDATGKLVVPGFIDAHMHVESAFLTPDTFAWATLPRGTTTVLADPHEIVNVAGPDALQWMIDVGKGTPQTQLWGVPSCVPAVDGLEHAGARLTTDDIERMLEWSGVVALGEVMDYRAVIDGDSRMHAIIVAARRRGVILDGHCPDISGADLSAYLAAGVDSDHCKNATDVAVEKARLGMMLMLQEKSLLPELMDALSALPHYPPICLVTDDLSADHIVHSGHLDSIARAAVRAGMPPVEALRALTLTPAGRLRLPDRGVVSPGKRADLVLLDGALGDFEPYAVVAGGTVVARDGVPESRSAPADHELPPATLTAPPVTADDYRWLTDLPDGVHAFRAIRVNDVDTSTQETAVELPVRDGEVRWEGRSAVVRVRNRYGGDGLVFAPVVGRDLSDGAVAMTYAHDSHNLVTIATSAAALRAATDAVLDCGGGFAVASGSRVVATLPLRVGGVMSTGSVEETARLSGEIRTALHAWGWTHPNVFMSVSTLTLAVSPALKVTDLSLVDVRDRAPVSSVV
ncbi:MAG: adenine deaminase C-terminal domain-containing protein [Streptosporangiales bacterium]